MDFLVISLLSAFIGAITLISGFGLGTVLMPAFAVFFPIEVAIAATGVVHLSNNLFKLALVGKHAQRDIVLRFGVPAIIAAIIGAGLMALLTDRTPVATYTIGSITAKVTWLKMLIALLLASFAALELWPRYKDLSFPPKMLPVGGALSGFFGGISGMQGALRAPFLLRAGLTKDQYVGTANVISTIVDCARLLAYVAGFTWLAKTRDYTVLTETRTLLLVASACIAGCAGSYLSSRYLKKMTLGSIRAVVSVLLFLFSITLASGII
ncbi:MAG: sulfite exporter TauE/SafE family protein [Phycisphaeraceae bacterium]|nr:sulfite exporter TauE/SafE family protein [Phycisphaerales bacterium]MCB9861538.1 sulfite exporter TauE/SafE family protein [Phycisphaeraceae bacterium]